jgi:hypothetical protein
MLGVDEGRDPAGLLGAGHRVQRDGRLAAALRSVDLHNPSPGQAADPQGDIQGDRAGGDHLDRRTGLVPQAHDCTLAVLLLDLAHHRFESLVAIWSCHVTHPCRVECGRAYLRPRPVAAASVRR